MRPIRVLICKIFGHRKIDNRLSGGHKHCDFCFSCIPPLLPQKESV